MDEVKCTLLHVEYSDGKQIRLIDPPSSVVTRALYKLASEWVQGAKSLDDLAHTEVEGGRVKGD